MTVKQLIKELRRFPLDMEVKVAAEYDAGFAWAGDDVDKVEVKQQFDKSEAVTIISYEKPF